MIKKITLSILLTCCFFIVLIPFNSNAQKVNGTYDYSYNLSINNSSYYISINDDIDFSYLNSNTNNFSYSINSNYNGIYYNQIDFLYSDGYGGYLISLYNSFTNNRLSWFNYATGSNTINKSEIFIYDKYISIYNGTPYNFITEINFNKIFNISNYIGGFYTFNNQRSRISFISFGTQIAPYEFDIYGSLVYQTDARYYLLNKIAINMKDSIYAYFVLFDSNGNEAQHNIDTFTNDTQYLRFYYFDYQYIDTYVYQWLNANGVWALNNGDYLNSNTNNSFVELFDAFANIPITILRSLLDFSVFSSSLTLFTIFATGVCVIVAIKIVKMFKD